MEKKHFEKHQGPHAFIKVTSPSIDKSDKASLNRKGNELFNSGDIEGARRVFMTTGYSDGLSRVGDYYKSKNRMIEALKMYWIAPDRKKANPLIIEVAGLLQNLMQEEGKTENE